MWRFGAGAVRRIVAGRKRATIVPVGPGSGPAVGEVVTAVVKNADGRVPVRLSGVAGPVEAAGVEAVASAAGLTLADFTVEASWAAYVEKFAEFVDAERAGGPFWVVSFVVAGAVSGTVPERKYPPKKKKKKKPAGESVPATAAESKQKQTARPKTATKNQATAGSTAPPKAVPDSAPQTPPQKSGQAGWLVVSVSSSGSTQLRPNNKLHPEDVAVLSARISQVLDRLRPPLTTRQSLSRVIGALLEERVCGPDGLPNTVRERLRGDLGKATAWLAQNKLLAGTVWNPRLVVGLRVYRR